MGRRKIEMHEYRNVLIRLRAGDRDREIARLGLMGRVKAANFRSVAQRLGSRVRQLIPVFATFVTSPSI